MTSGLNPRPVVLALTLAIGIAAIALSVTQGNSSAGASASGRKHHVSTPVSARWPRSSCRPLAGTGYGSGGVSYVTADLRRVQTAVDRRVHCYLYYLNPVQVTVHDLPRYGFAAGPIAVISPPAPHVAPTAHHGEDGLPETDVIVTYRGRRFWIVLNQFERRGPAGIWAIITITPY